MPKTQIIKSDKGAITKEEVLDLEPSEAVKKIAVEALNEWREQSDFYIMKDEQEFRRKGPLKPSEYEKLKKFLGGKEGNEIILKVPVYYISYENEWKDNDIVDTKIYIIAPYIDDEATKELKDLAIHATSPDQDVEEEETEE